MVLLVFKATSASVVAEGPRAAPASDGTDSRKYYTGYCTVGREVSGFRVDVALCAAGSGHTDPKIRNPGKQDRGYSRKRKSRGLLAQRSDGTPDADGKLLGR